MSTELERRYEAWRRELGQSPSGTGFDESLWSAEEQLRRQAGTLLTCISNRGPGHCEALAELAEHFLATQGTDVTDKHGSSKSIPHHDERVRFLRELDALSADIASSSDLSRQAFGYRVRFAVNDLRTPSSFFSPRADVEVLVHACSHGGNSGEASLAHEALLSLKHLDQVLRIHLERIGWRDDPSTREYFGLPTGFFAFAERASGLDRNEWMLDRERRKFF